MIKKKKHYLFYQKNSLELYAYTESHRLAKGFEAVRDMEKFYKKEVVITPEERKALFEEHQESLLSMQKLKGIGEDYPMVMTSMEWLCVESRASNLLIVQLPLLTEINPMIFTEEYLDAFRILGYTDVYKYSHDPNADYSLWSIFAPNTLFIFLELYGDTLR